MIATAKIFKTGSSQAVRLPKAFYLEGDKVWISKDDATGIITLTPKSRAERLEALFKLIEEAEVPEDFMAERHSSFDEQQ